VCCGYDRLCQTNTLLQSHSITDLLVAPYCLKQLHSAIFCSLLVYFVDLPKSVYVSGTYHGISRMHAIAMLGTMYCLYLNVTCCKMELTVCATMQMQLEIIGKFGCIELLQ